LVSVKAALVAFDRVVQQVALGLDKAVEPITVDGADVLVDPQTYQPLLRSLVHVFRNAVSHGIERPEERLKAGKAESGRITCSLSSTAGGLIIEIADDGGGINVARLRQRAKVAGFDQAGELAELPDDQLMQLIFLDNLSTADAVDHIAGRGVGLAAVKQAVEGLAGSVSVRSVPDLGTSIIIRLPRPRDPMSEEKSE
jgi:two-component system chemotaxis sensor kinase CheA